MSTQPSVGHLVRRFFTSVRGREPSELDERWARGALSPTEVALWEQMTPTDRAHGVEVARRVAEHSDDAQARVAALLHDVGKTVAGAGVVLRVVATLSGPFVSDRRAAAWSSRRGPLRRLAQQLSYPQIGAQLLADAGACQLAIQWAAEHHQASTRWTVDPELGRLLQAADDASS